MPDPQDDADVDWVAAFALTKARLTPGLSTTELDGVEARYGFCFAPDHRAFLSAVLPVDDSGEWPDWRHGPEEGLRQRLAWPVEGLLLDVASRSFWHEGWPPRPVDAAEALAEARTRLAAAPLLVPLWAHRYLPTAPQVAGNPVISCWQSDVVWYGNDLLSWLAKDFEGPPVAPGSQGRHFVPFWTEVIDAPDPIQQSHTAIQGSLERTLQGLMEFGGLSVSNVDDARELARLLAEDLLDLHIRVDPEFWVPAEFWLPEDDGSA